MDNTVTRPAIFYLTVSHWRVSRRCSLLLTNSSSTSSSNSNSSSSCSPQRSFQSGVFNLIHSGTKKAVAVKETLPVKGNFDKLLQYTVIVIHLLSSADCVCYSLLFPHNGGEILFWLGQAKCTIGARLDYDCLNLCECACLLRAPLKWDTVGGMGRGTDGGRKHSARHTLKLVASSQFIEQLEKYCSKWIDDCCLSASVVDITLRISSTYHNYCHRSFTVSMYVEANCLRMEICQEIASIPVFLCFYRTHFLQMINGRGQIMLAVVTLLANKCRGLFCFADSAGRCFSGEFRQSFTSTSVECCLPSAAFIRACLVLLGMSRYCKKTARRFCVCFQADGHLGWVPFFSVPTTHGGSSKWRTYYIKAEVRLRVRDRERKRGAIFLASFLSAHSSLDAGCQLLRVHGCIIPSDEKEKGKKF
ncbi:hypothetical protein T01_5135 [Trichinella spiralis]|uniref:Uncharacterized protein n=1 Tax=Trichinella spiralis TaxID=6334 RepID=A0A0V1B2F1_TRISP|nr:hypothetical protein T01_14567 [Trichinella spiralis]KRY31229.1 hypothetical protein T01_5135 [Trichinella spiralis]